MPKGIYKRTKPVWNKGLTKENDERVKKNSMSRIGKSLSEEHKRKISNTAKLKGVGKWMKGIPKSESHKQKMRKQKSESHKQKVSETRKRLFKEGKLKHGMLGRKNSHTKEWGEMMSKKMKGIPLSEEIKTKMKLERKGIYGRNNFKFSKESKKKMRISRVEYIKKTCGFLHPNIGHNEKKIIDKLEEELNYKIIRQYKVCGYFVDGYIKELNSVVEVDERPKNKERDIERQKIIEDELNCKFLRIADFN